MLPDTACRNANPRGKPYKLSDGKGLYLEIKPNGVKAWRYRFELREDEVTKESTFAIGDYATVPSGETPDEAQTRRAHIFFALLGASATAAKSRPTGPEPSAGHSTSSKAFPN